eukprot:456419-Rhodomonas_salina.1
MVEALRTAVTAQCRDGWVSDGWEWLYRVATVGCEEAVGVATVGVANRRSSDGWSRVATVGAE